MKRGSEDGEKIRREREGGKNSVVYDQEQEVHLYVSSDCYTVN